MKPPASSATLPQDRVPFWRKVAYGLGGCVENTAVGISQGNLTPVFNIGLGLNPALLGVVTFVWRAWDACADVFFGNLSDNARTRWGRRRPFLVVGAVLTGLTMPLIWWVPPGWSSMLVLAWLTLGGIIFYTCFSFWAMPYYSLQLEMTPDYNERTNITAHRTFAQQFLVLAGSWILALAARPFFSTHADHRPDLLNGMRYISVGLALLTIILGMLPGLFVQERYYEKDASRQPKEKLWTGLKQTLTTRPFLYIVLIVFLKTFGFSLVGVMGFYINTYYVCRGDLTLSTEIGGVSGTLLALSNFFFIPFCNWLANRIGKKAMLYVTVYCGIASVLSMAFFITPAHPWWQLVPPLVLNPIGMGLWLVIPSMQADVADYDELMTHQRREGSFAAVFSWTTKASTALAGGISGVLLVLTGFDATIIGHQPDTVLAHMKFLYIGVPLLFLVATLPAIHGYDLTLERVQDIRRKLEARRGAV
jgi:GPH family glycoside/pentoside/hexuronide:cation symporter